MWDLVEDPTRPNKWLTKPHWGHRRPGLENVTHAKPKIFQTQWDNVANLQLNIFILRKTQTIAMNLYVQTNTFFTCVLFFPKNVYYD